MAQRESEIPREFREFLESVGVDPSKEAEVWEAGPIEDNYSLNGGWWHFIGKVEREGVSVIELSSEPSGRAREWSVVFLPGQRSLKLHGLPEAPLVKVEFSVKLPWVLDEHYPGQ